MPQGILNPLSTSTPLVSVPVTTFNLEKLLPVALDGALGQRIDFPIEIVIGDDASTDGTLCVARSYRERYPNVIRILERTKNSGVQRNTYDTLEGCTGKYIAVLDGDDCWTDSEKLALQVRALEADPSINICAHFVRWVNAQGQVLRERYPSLPAGRYGLEEVLRHNFIPTLSVMFRNGIHRQLPSCYFGLGSTSDWPLWVLLGLSGDVLLLDKLMGDYLVSSSSAFTSKGAIFWYKADIDFYNCIESILPLKWHEFARAEKGKRYEAMAYMLRQQGNFVGSREAAMRAFSSPALTDNVGTKTKALIAALVREAQWRFGRGWDPR